MSQTLQPPASRLNPAPPLKHSTPTGRPRLPHSTMTQILRAALFPTGRSQLRNVPPVCCCSPPPPGSATAEKARACMPAAPHCHTYYPLETALLALLRSCLLSPPHIALCFPFSLRVLFGVHKFPPYPLHPCCPSHRRPPTCDQREPLDAVKVSVLNGHHPRISKQLLREVVDELHRGVEGGTGQR